MLFTTRCLCQLRLAHLSTSSLSTHLHVPIPVTTCTNLYPYPYPYSHILEPNIHTRRCTTMINPYTKEKTRFYAFSRSLCDFSCWITTSAMLDDVTGVQIPATDDNGSMTRPHMRRQIIHHSAILLGFSQADDICQYNHHVSVKAGALQGNSVSVYSTTRCLCQLRLAHLSTSSLSTYLHVPYCYTLCTNLYPYPYSIFISISSHP